MLHNITSKPARHSFGGCCKVKLIEPIEQSDWLRKMMLQEFPDCCYRFRKICDKSHVGKALGGKTRGRTQDQ